MSEMTMERVEQMRGTPVMDNAGEQIGKVEEIFYDEQTRQPEWVGIGTGFLGTKRVLVPIRGADASGEAFTVPYSKDHVKGAPDIDGDEISEQTEQELYRYYSLGGRGGAQAAETGESVTRHEEELAVGKQDVEAGRARLRKRVETEPVEMDVELKRETARVTRETIDQPVADANLGEQEVEVPLRAEQPVVAKQTVAKERIGLEKDVETERQTVSDEVRKERVDIDES